MALRARASALHLLHQGMLWICAASTYVVNKCCCERRTVSKCCIKACCEWDKATVQQKTVINRLEILKLGTVQLGIPWGGPWWQAPALARGAQQQPSGTHIGQQQRHWRLPVRCLLPSQSLQHSNRKNIMTTIILILIMIMIRMMMMMRMMILTLCWWFLAHDELGKCRTMTVRVLCHFFVAAFFWLSRHLPDLNICYHWLAIFLQWLGWHQ